MANFYEDNEDLQFYVDQWIDWEPIVRLTEYDYQAPDGFESADEAVEFYTDVLRLVGEFVGDAIDPITDELDAAKPELVDGEVVYPEVHTELFEQIKQMELHGLCIPRELGGMNAPLVVNHLQLEMFARADVSVAAHHGFHGSIALAALMYSVLEGTTEFDDAGSRIVSTRFEQAIREIIAGEAWGSMDITEPHAGSDMAALRCKAEQDDEGNWFVTGPKTFITSGHGKWHFVIARTEHAAVDDDPFAGLGGLSMFLVPAYETGDDGQIVREHTTLDGLEDKLGHHGSATVAISFERAPAHLIGERGQGFKMMLLLMNGARVGVGFESLGLCEAAYRMAKGYAEQRPSMGKSIDRHEMIADYLDEMKTDIQGIRAITVRAATEEELAQKIRLELEFRPPKAQKKRDELKRELKRHQRRARHLTPLVKYLASEKAVQIARRNIQIHGGSGYITEYGAEKLLRDAMVFPIYEGTSQIQALMAMKDNLMGVVKDPARFMREMAQARWRSVSSRDPHERRVARLQTTAYSTLQFLVSRLATTKLKELPRHPVREWGEVMTGWDPKRDFALAMLHAERLTKILADVAVAEELLAQAQEHAERVEVLERWLERAEPRCRYLHDEITTTGLRLLDELHGPADPAEQAADQAAK